MSSLHIPFDRRGPHRVRAVDPDGHVRLPATLEVASEHRRDLQRHADVVCLKPVLQDLLAGQLLLLREISRAPERLDIGPACRRTVLVEDGERHALHVRRDAIAEDEEQDRAPDEREAEAHRIAQQLLGLARRIGPEPDEAQMLRKLGAERSAAALENGLALLRRALGEPVGAVQAIIDRHGLEGILHVRDERFLKRPRPLCLDEFLGLTDGEDPSRMHQRNAIATHRLVHEVRRDEDRHVVVARKFAQHPPEFVARLRIDPGRRFVEDQHLRFVQDRDRERQALAHAKRQPAGKLVEIALQAEPARQFRNPGLGLLPPEMEQAGVKIEVLAHRQFAIERERL